jgi:hypothetical protein
VLFYHVRALECMNILSIVDNCRVASPPSAAHRPSVALAYQRVGRKPQCFSALNSPDDWSRPTNPSAGLPFSMESHPDCCTPQLVLRSSLARPTGRHGDRSLLLSWLLAVFPLAVQLPIFPNGRSLFSRRYTQLCAVPHKSHAACA